MSIERQAHAHTTAVARLLDMYKVPGPKWHVAVGRLLIALVTNHWCAVCHDWPTLMIRAVRAFADTPSALEWATDRETDAEWEPVQAKHDLVCQLLHSDDAVK